MTRLRSRHFLLLAAILTARSALANVVITCEAPIYSSFDEAIADTPIIFIGTAVRQCQDGGTFEVTLAVSAVYRGDVPSEVVIRTPNHELQLSSCCGLRFVPGQEYLVFARFDSSTDACTRTKRLVEAKDDRALLGVSRSPKPPRAAALAPPK